MFMNKLQANIKLISPLYLLWIISLILVGAWSISNLPLSPSFPYYNQLEAIYSRTFASFAHFDGIHYLRLINRGYDDTGSQAFFPVYPYLIRFLSFGKIDPLVTAICVNTLLSFLTIYLVSLRLKSHQVIRFILLFLSFPASFFLLANYTESLFIFLVALFFHLTYLKRYFWAAVVAGIASGTRLVGIFLVLSLLIELLKNRHNLMSSVLYLILGSTGLLGYLYYLFIRFGDPLMFIHVQTMFDNGRSGGDIILLPQVLYRYLRILLTANPTTIVYLRAFWELLTFISAVFILLFYRKKMELSQLLFCICAVLLPTLSGTLSSFPRYLLVALPIFIVISQHLNSRVFWVVTVFQYAILIATTALFVQGIFIA